MLKMGQLVIKSFICLITLFSCKKNDYECKIHYQYVVYKKNDNDYRMKVYCENFLYLSNTSNDTLRIKTKDIIEKYKFIYKKDTLNLKFMNDEDIFVLPKSSIDLNCIVDLDKTVSRYPETMADSLQFNIFDVSKKKFLDKTKDYEIMNTRNFMIYKFNKKALDSLNYTL